MAIDDHSSAIVARDELGFYALSGTCPHACCTVTICSGQACSVPLVSPNDCAPAVRGTLSARGATFLCPCHGSQFSANGSVLTGPSRLALPSVALRLIGKDVIVDLSQAVPADARVSAG
jgi:Rieske Fe-S protein